MSYLDLVAYAYLKEELVNTQDSAEVKYVQSDCPKLMKFVAYFDQVLLDKNVIIAQEI